MSTLIEKHIVSLLAEKDDRAIALLYENYGDTLYGVAHKVVKDDDLAQDVLQESFIKIWKKADSYDASKAKLFTWLFRITRNTAIDKLRSVNNKASKEVQIDVSDVYNLGVSGISPEHLDIQENLDKIEPKYRIVLEALFFEGMTQQEASEELDIPLGTIKSRLKIGLRELGKIYGTTMALLIVLNLLS
ncbi:sigma-70 family RNA polymerase sigma factor [Flagellimonas taeanensis]|jgi:RNA polymerase sigma-70 factor (ECF subfamily)|uniref:RNA polymerase sigma factor n=1 Tax=Flagellimonas taeanensis TaxID=1005926 RepID=A0A3A1NZK3_9FLAO|nr:MULTISPECIES: sigma-70 family RNA polymerase sigma factor [Allomuricauda]MDC6384374.1 sigma-70 family RNA polymerase sigma factor [Muricauda sp. SK9]MEE1962454.1 sigma-70 family RNA polymerase sigma factor [Allomuricauda taeanensis]RIV49724.1 sigma-70 family RNA polymerase sigma factor [Allomuricauda taeanensis]RIV53923.1 sigma-70 family RNA polymerase sigma factor [Allomuricauda taeanensis]SFC59159.1 RNA polymerase sigma-70 factor, ECF subfamily [Allomuricauda taeanensis]